MDYRERARQIAQEEGVNPDLFLKLVGAESGFNPAARSPKGAMGLGQLMPATAAELGVDPADPEQNLRGSARYLRQMHDKFKSTPLALAAYNAGPGRVARAGGIPKIAETEAYVARVNQADDDSDIFGTIGKPQAAKASAAPAKDFGDDADIFGSPEPVRQVAKPTVAPVKAQEMRADQGLGFAAGVMKPLDNMARAALMIPGVRQVDETMGRLLNLPTADQAIANRQDALAGYAKRGIRPGGVGKVLGEMLGTSPTLMLPGGVLAQGAASGALLTDKKDAPGIVGDAITGAAAGKVAEVGLNALSKVLAPKVQPLVERLRAAGVTPTPGQVLGGGFREFEDKLTSLPLAGSAVSGARQRTIDDFNRAAINRALGPIGQKLPKDVDVGHDAVKFAQDTLSNAYDELLPSLRVQPDQELVEGLKALTPMIQQLPAARQKQLKTVVDQAVKKLTANGSPIDGLAFKKVESDLGEFVRRYGGAADGDQQAMAEVAREIQGELRGMLARQNPQAADKLKAINTGYANLVRVQDAASRTGADEGVFSPAGLLQAVRAADKSGRKTAMAKGEALLQDLAGAGKSVLSQKVGNTGTADRWMQGNLLSTLAGLGAGLPVIPAYSKTGQEVLYNLLTKRPDMAKRIGALLPKLTGPAALSAEAAAVGARSTGIRMGEDGTIEIDINRSGVRDRQKKQ